MSDKIIKLEEYRNNLQNKIDLDNNNITIDELSLEEIEGVNKLYKMEIKELTKDIENRARNIERLEKENKMLRKILGDNKKY